MRNCAYVVAGVLTFGLAAPLLSETVFELGFDAPEEIEGEEGSVEIVDVTGVLTHTGDGSGAQGWQIIAEADGATFTDVTLDGTDAGATIDTNELFPGFPCNFQTNQMSPDGTLACSAVVLSFCEDRVLPTNATSSVLALTLAVPIPDDDDGDDGDEGDNGDDGDDDATVTLRWVDVPGCFAGVAEENIITQDGVSFIPVLGETVIEVDD